MGVISLVSLTAVILLSYRNAGQATVKYGIIGLLSAVYSLAGFILGVSTVAKKDYYRIFPVLGIVLNGMVLAGLGLMVYMGVTVE